jgi:glycosyltransferase involved in cell wall biosynthesis
VRIVYWIENFWPHIGGIEVFTANLAPLMRERGHEVTVITSLTDERLSDRDTFKGVPVHRFPMTDALHSRDLDRILAVRRRVADLWSAVDPDVGHVRYGFGPSVYFLPTAIRGARSPVMVTIPGFMDAAPTGPSTVVGNTLSHSSWVTFTSEAVREHVLKLFPELATRSSVIYNGLAPPAVRPTPLPFGPPVVLCAGRLSEEKGFDVAVRAFARAWRSHPEARLFVAGEGTERERLQSLAHELEIAGAVEFLGWISPEEVPDLLNRATVVVVPSRALEGFGLVALEAALMKRPVVASRMGGLPEVVADGETGLLFENEDSDGLARAIMSLLDDPERAARMGHAASARARRLFSLERCADAYEDHYRKLAKDAERVSA